MREEFLCQSPGELNQIAKDLLQSHENRILAFYGPMGVGKTTFIKAICTVLKVEDPVSSPSFSIVNEYLSIEGNPVYHFDFYRIKDPREAFDMGYEHYFYSDAYCLIEWPEKIQGLLPENHLEIHMQLKGEQRQITVKESK